MKTFEQFVASKRKERVQFALRNPSHADAFAYAILQHLKTVSKWIDGKIDRQKMLEAMKFFALELPHKYEPDAGHVLYRGQIGEIFDGLPASYSYDPKVAEQFAGGYDGSIIIQRKVCYSCLDGKAFRLALDLKKLLRAYSEGHITFSHEREVVILNTRPAGKTAYILVAEDAA